MADSPGTPKSFSGYTCTVNDIARKLKYHPQYVRFLASQGKLPAIKRTRLWLFNEAEVFNFLAAKQNSEGANHGTIIDSGEDSLLS